MRDPILQWSELTLSPIEDGQSGVGLQSESCPHQFQGVPQRRGGGAAGALPHRLEGAGQVFEQPGCHVLLHLQGCGGEAADHGAPAQRPAARPLRQPAVHGGLRGGQPAGGPGAPLQSPRLGLPDGASAAPGTALAAALPGEPAHQPRGRAHLRALHGLLQRLTGCLPPLDCPPGRHRGLLHTAHSQGLPGDHECRAPRAGRGDAGPGLALHRARVRCLPEALCRARPAGPALGAGGPRLGGHRLLQSWAGAARARQCHRAAFWVLQEQGNHCPPVS